ncbi:MAG: F0F1 ATP synthase subunit epsilon [Cardiobacteriaceae bacterium]|nr:F0F1 ATP synthase subunit epsilon [Cardiobacteriaceae bacterium]
MKPFQVSVVSQDRLLYEGDVLQVSATAEAGELGVLAGHTPLMANLKAGQVRLQLEGNKEEVLYISGGFLEVQPHKTIILADEALHAADLDEEAVKKAKERAEERMKGVESSDEHAMAQLELAQIAAQLSAIRRAKR